MSSSAGDGGAAPQGTGRVVAGECAIDVGAPGGTRLALIPPDDRKPTEQLADALGPPGAELRAPADFLKDVVDEGSEAADAVENAVALVTAAAHGGLADPAAINVEIDVLLRALTRLDRDGRYQDEIDLARTVANLLALLERWWELVQTLLRAFDSAKHLAEPARDHAQAWALHELGTLSACAGRPRHATELLGRAREIRTRINDHQGLAATTQNLALTGTRMVAVVPRRPRLAGRSWCVAGSAAAILIGGAFGAVGYHLVSDSSSPPAAITLLADPHGTSSLTYTGYAPRRRGYNAFVDVRVFNAANGHMVGFSGRAHLSPTGGYSGTIPFTASLAAGQYYAQASQGRGASRPHGTSVAVWFSIATPPPSTSNPPPQQAGLTITAPSGAIGSYPTEVTGTSSNAPQLPTQFVRVVIYEGGTDIGSRPSVSPAVPIQPDGSWSVDLPGKVASGTEYTLLAESISQDGTTVPANAIVSPEVMFTFSPPEVVPPPTGAGT